MKRTVTLLAIAATGLLLAGYSSDPSEEAGWQCEDFIERFTALDHVTFNPKPPKVQVSDDLYTVIGRVNGQQIQCKLERDDDGWTLLTEPKEFARIPGAN
jgi:hypothetical protein